MKKNDIHIMVVDDDANIRDVLAQAISRAGFKVTAVASPSAAEALVKMKPVHLAIYDCMLPAMNGVDLAKSLSESTLKGVPCILMSGIFKDDQFADDAIKKSGAAKFFTKPFDIEELLLTISEEIKPLLDAKSGTLDSLLTKLDLTKREVKKSFDFIDNVSGYDLMLILGVLFKANSSGYFNVSDSQGDIFGFTLKDGAIVNIDTLVSKPHIGDLLEAKNIMTRSEYKKLLSGKEVKHPLEFLVKENYLSPHLVHSLKTDKVIEDLKFLISQDGIGLNFIENRDVDSEDIKVNLLLLNSFFYSIIDNIPIAWLSDFYSEWSNKVINIDEQYDMSTVSHFIRIENKNEIYHALLEGPSLEELTEKFGRKEALVIVHFLLVNRALFFANERKLVNMSKHIERIREIHAKIQGKNPYEIFQFFGAGHNPPYKEVEKIYKEFVKANHPDKMPQNTDPEVVKLNHEIFTWMSDAHDMLSDPNKRKLYKDKIQEGEAKKQIRAEDLGEKAFMLLERQKYTEAWELLQEAYSLHRNSNIDLYHIWAQIKVEPEVAKKEFARIADSLEMVDQDDKRTAIYCFVKGLFEGLCANYDKAEGLFSRALEFNSGFLPARRELAAVKSQPRKKSPKTTDFLTGDITSIVKDLFKKNKKTG